jgi:ornithine carbamoyltransferase
MPWLAPQHATKKKSNLRMPSQSLFNKSIALLFSKRSTRTRIAAETAAVLLGGRALFLGSSDIQFGVNESPRDSARVIGGMCQGIFARVGAHEEIEVRKSFTYYSYIYLVYFRSSRGTLQYLCSMLYRHFGIQRKFLQTS